ncbi:hypothetical protein [Companilactobacillus mishanensis]|uniref:hypothetical protein n=1 Tax=Companilactobacillus mishanensis TaxID=2486008 RepID=UPI001297F4D9|nr:hypothetical protein [Companilactobacillus mishanensis]
MTDEKPFSAKRWNEDPLIGATIKKSVLTKEQKERKAEFMKQVAKAWGIKRTPKSK